MAGKFTAQKHAETKAQLDQGNADYFKARQGVNRVRLFPPPGDHDDISAEAWVHVQEEDGDFQKWNCPKRHGGKKCEYCEYADHYRSKAKAGDKKADKLVRQYGARREVYFVVDDVKDPKPKGGMVWTVSKKRAKEIYAVCYNDEGDFIDVSDPKKGFDIIFQRTGEGLDTEYTGLKRADKSTPLRDLDWLDDYPDVREIANRDGAPAKGSEDDEEEEETPVKPGKGSAKAKPVEDDEEGEEAPAKPGKAKGKAKPVQEAEEGEEEAEEGEEAPAPAPAKAGKAKAKPEPEEEDDTPPPCYGKEWVKGDPICTECPFQNEGPDGACKDIVTKIAAKAASPAKTKFAGKPVATADDDEESDEPPKPKFKGRGK